MAKCIFFHEFHGAIGGVFIFTIEVNFLLLVELEDLPLEVVIKEVDVDRIIDVALLEFERVTQVNDD